MNYTNAYLRTRKRDFRFGMRTLFLGLLFLLCIKTISLNTDFVRLPFMDQMISSIMPISPLAEKPTKQHEVFGFAPYWNMHKLDSVDFSVLITLAYFGVDVTGDGKLDTEGQGYKTFMSDNATNLFQKAHEHGTRVVLTLTQMDNDTIKTFLDNKEGQEVLISDTIALLKKRGIDGVNVDFEYVGDPGPSYRNKFSQFVKELTMNMHEALPEPRITVSVYASSVKDPKLYDVQSLAQNSNGIFMMAYDFGTTGSTKVMPTSPLYGYKEGKYWYDVSTAVDAFLALMPAEKLILGLPWYGYNYPVVTPGEKTAVHDGYYTYYWWRGRKYSQFHPLSSNAQTYASVKEDIQDASSGWDDIAKVGWKAYQDEDGIWRMIFIDDARSLTIKYDFAKEKELLGVGIWALGFDGQNNDMWAVLREEFGTKLADSRIQNTKINDSL